MRSTYSHVLLVRYACSVIRDSGGGAAAAPLYAYLDQCLRHKNEMVVYEAARGICKLPEVSSRELVPAIMVLQLFLTSPRSTLKFAAVRALNELARRMPMAVTACNADLGNLVADPNRSVATLAITTLLLTGNESSVDKLVKQTTTFMAEISDEFKVVVIEALRAMCVKFPAKHRSLMAFFSSSLREEGGFAFKKAVVNALVYLIGAVPEARELGLAHLCEFIEDCEHSLLCINVLNLLGTEGPTARDPSKFVRYVYNRYC